MIVRAGIVGIAAFALSGCAYMNATARKYSDSALYVWNSDYSAGIGTKNGICVQAATTMSAVDTDTTVKVSEDILKLAQIPALQSSGGDLLDLGVTTQETVARTNATTAQTAYANIAFFYLCQVSLNGQVSEESVVEMWKATSSTIPLIGQIGGEPTAIRNLPGNGPAPAAPNGTGSGQ